MPRAAARAWAASCSSVPRTSRAVAAQSFAADHDFGALPGAGVPAAGSVVTPHGVFAFGAGRDDDHHSRELPVPGPDRRPDVFQHADDAAEGGTRVAGCGDRSGGDRGPGRVIRLAAGRVGQDLIGFGDGLEPLSGARVAGVGVGVMLAGQFPVRLLDLRGGGAGWDAEGGVVVRGPGTGGHGVSGVTQP